MTTAKIWLDLITLLVAVVALILSCLSFRWNSKVSMLSADNNLIQYASALLDFLERAKKLDEKEKRLFKNLLMDSKFFEETTQDTLFSLALKQWTIDRDLKEYFKTL